MNLNEECLLHFLKNPEGLEETLEQLKTYLFLKDKTAGQVKKFIFETCNGATLQE